MSNATDTKQLTADEVLERLNAINPFSEDHPEEWRNKVAHDLNHIINGTWGGLEHHDSMDTEFGAAVLRIVERVAEFEKIEAKGKPNE